MEQVEGFEPVNANIRRPKTVVLDQIGNPVSVGRVAAAAAPYVVATETGDSILRKTVLACTALPIAFLDDAGIAQYGGVQLYDFLEGMLCVHGAVVAGSITGVAPLIDTYTGVVGIGTATAGTGATLVGTESDVLQSAALTQAVAKVANCDSQSIATALTEAGSRWLDGTAAAKSAFLNVAIADNAAHTAGTLTFTGTVTIVWMLLGDN